MYPQSPDLHTVADYVNHWAATTPNKVYLQSADTGSTVTCMELQTYCLQISNWLDAENIAKNEIVAFLLENGWWTTCLFIGIMYSGRTVLPLNIVSGPDQLRYVISHAKPSKLLYSRKCMGDCFGSDNSILDDTLTLECDENQCPEAIVKLDYESNGTDICPDYSDTALLIYTSGTTGRPKGVLLTHANVIAGGRNTKIAHELGPEDSGLCVLPLYHINAEMVSVMGTLVSNGRLVIAKKFSTSGFWNWILDYQCSWFSVVPTIVSYLIADRESNPEKTFPDLQKQVRFGRSASAALSVSEHEKFESLFDIGIVETMGISECAAQILSNPLQAGKRRYGSVGFPVGNEARIVDDVRNPVDDNTPGEIAVRGPNVMNGYLDNPQATRECLDHHGWFYTGDLGYRDSEGYYFVTGRKKELIIRGGENISPREIDEVLYRHPDIVEAAAYGVDDPSYGQEVVAAVVLKENANCDEKQLIEHCRTSLGNVKCPKVIRFMDQLPKGPSGKIQRSKLITA